jgi:hypothetical protein
LDLIDGFEKEKLQSNSIIISANAKAFCLLIRQNLLEGQTNRLIEEINLYERQIRECSGDIIISTEKQKSYMKERMSLLENQIIQTKQESDFYIKQVQDLERGLRNSTELDYTLFKNSALSYRESDPNNQFKKTQSEFRKRLELLAKQKDLEKSIQNEKVLRDASAEKIKSIQATVADMPESEMDVMLKKVMILDQVHFFKKIKFISILGVTKCEE